jgi:hypothetical protein
MCQKQSCPCKSIQITIAGCVFRGLKGDIGTAWTLATKPGRDAVTASAALFSCVFEDNHALKQGPGVYMESQSSLMLSQCELRGNGAPTEPDIAADDTSVHVYANPAVTIAVAAPHDDLEEDSSQDSLAPLVLQSLPLTQAPPSMFLAIDDATVVHLEEVRLQLLFHNPPKSISSRQRIFT